MALRAKKKRDAERAHDNNQEFFHKVNEAAITAANLALRMSLLLNGGAAISLLTFIGTLDHDKKPLVAGGLVWFAWGAAAAVAGIALAYLTNFCTAGIAGSKKQIWQWPFLEDTPAAKTYTRIKTIFHIAAIVVEVASLGLFIYGMLAVKTAITHLT